MAGNDTNNVQYLTPPAVTALRQEARSVESKKYPTMRTSSSENMREERQDLREAAEQTLNVIVDLDLEGRVKWVSPSWNQVVGTAPETIQGQMISDVLVDNKSAFCDAIESLMQDDSRSRFIRVSIQLGPESVLKTSPESQPQDSEHAVDACDNGEKPSSEVGARGPDILNLEGQGIMVYDRTAEGVSHTMWMLRPFSRPREVTIDLPSLLVESLGVGAEVLANYLTVLAEAAANEPDQSKHPAPEPILCRICERQITPWWFEKHSDLCLQEHQAEMDVQIAQENLNEHRHAIVKVLDALEARQGRPTTPHEGGPPPLPQPEYKGLPIGPPPLASGPSSGSTSNSSSSPATPPRSRDQSVSGMNHARGRSFAVRRPLARVAELILDLCDTALEINMPVLKDTRGDNDDELRTMSPQSESRMSQVINWQSPSSNTLEQEQGLAVLCTDTEEAAKAKVDAVVRHRRIVEYAERIRIEYTVLVEECIAAALRKAERIAAGQLSDTSSSDDEGAPDVTIPDPAASSTSLLTRNAGHESELPPPVSALTMTMNNTSDRFRSGQSSDGKASSVAVSTGPSSPMECPTPRSHKSAIGLLGTSQPPRRGLSMAEFDSGDQSDSSIVSSTIPGAVRTDSPSSDRSLDRKRKSLVLPGLSGSPRRQHSPARTSGPHSPLRMPKGRISTGPEHFSSPIVSPSANIGELALHHYRHHRRQSSTASSDVPRPPVSPHLTTASQPQPRPVPPSIKDFEIIKPISKGAFGSVYLSKKKTTGEYYAIKVLKKADMVAKNQVTNVKAERAIMMWQGESDFVAKLYWTFSSKDYLYLVMEYLNGGDCASLVKILGGLPEDWAKKYIAEVVLGVEHLHGRGIVHRDLKPDNLLIDQKGHLKLTDFGLSRMGLVGRQKRVLKSMNEHVVDNSKQGSFPRATSIASSRSASFDFQGNSSPGSTPLITPDVANSMPQPSYFSLNQGGLSRQTSRRASGYRSDSGGSENLHGIFRTLSLNEGDETPGALPIPHPPESAHEDEAPSEAGESPSLQPLQPTQSNVSTGTPPQQAMMPPLMALFDPEDHNRRFVGTPDYLAPETINGVGQDEMSDWWSLGCIMFEFLFGYPPFNAGTPDEVFDNILYRRINWPEELEELATPESIDLMNKLMAINPRDRIGANLEEKYPNGGAEIRDHPWFSDISWDTLLEDKAQFVPNLENPEDTEYFDARGATLQAFTEEDESSPHPPVTTGSYSDRPHDALNRVRSQVNSMKRPLMPLHIPPHVRETRESRNRRLSEPSSADDFGNFAFKNLTMLEKANKDVIQRMRQEAIQAQQRHPSNSGNHQLPQQTQSQAQPQSQPQGQGPTPPLPGPSLEGSPLPMSLQRTMSQSKGNNRPASPSALSQANSSPSRPSQPSSPLLVQFSTGHNHERRKTSGSSSTTTSHQSSGSFQPAPADPNRAANNSKFGSVASSPIKTGRGGTHSPDKGVPIPSRQGSASTRTRSQTIGSQDGGELSSSLARETYVAGHHKRRSQLFDVSPSSSDNEDPRTKALLKVQRRRQSSRRLSHINIADGPFFRPLDILICEDHPISRLVMERLFEKLRCRTITVANGAEAVRYALSDVQFDMIMTEYKLPQVNGADVARMVRESRSANRHTPIVAVTGYLKDLPEMHHFDTLIEKPPTLTKFTEVLCKFCQWKPPPKDYNLSTFTTSSSARQTPPAQIEHSPSSTVSSGFALVPSSSYRGSSREDSIGSSYFGDLDSIKAEDVPVILSRQTDDWGHNAGGLGISEDSSTTQEPADARRESQKTVPFPSLPHAVSSPPALSPSGMLTPRKQRSSEAIRAKRESLERKRYECAESGDDEDEELGTLPPRTQSPRNRPNRPGSKLGIEMMRTNSRGSVISTGEDVFRKDKDVHEGGKSGSDDGDEITGAVAKSSRNSLESRFEELSIPEEAILPSIEDELSPNSPSPIALASRSMLFTPDAKPPFSRYITEIYKREGSRSGSESPKRGHITPPVVFRTGAEGSSQPLPTTPPIVLSDDSGDVGLEQSASPPIDSDATPRPMHTPLPNTDPETTPRPGK
ncbi:protein kinase RIM15 [Aspergillus stella-maris]|uniref:protein kinase RIM15 n=1 Tax=Aspergillus stella-maris TaxID=1810926 RepID=UPI003CCD86D2